MMRQCWEKSPHDRPTFKELYSTVSKYIERVAGYLDMGFNPFSGREGAATGMESNEGKREGEDKDVEGDSFQFQLIPPSIPTNVTNTVFTNITD